MTRIEEDIVFVHTSDIQLLDDQAVDKILDWEPDIALADAPSIYLSRLSKAQMDKSWHNAVKLSQKIDKLILDHHLMRSREGLEWLKQLSHKTGNTVICAADFMQKPRLLLEADRMNLYNKISVPVNWHEDYEKGKVDTSGYWDSAKKLYNFRS